MQEFTLNKPMLPMDGHVSIGRFSRKVGIAPDTLRIWERRYGNPKPARLPSGHRRYPSDDIYRMQCVAKLRRAGHRPSVLLQLTTAELEAKLQSIGNGSVNGSAPNGTATNGIGHEATNGSSNGSNGSSNGSTYHPTE